MVESSKSLFLLLLFVFMAAAIGWALVSSWGSFDLTEAVSLRAFREGEQATPAASEPAVAGSVSTPTSEAAPVQRIDRYPVVSLRPNSKPLFAP